MYYCYFFLFFVSSMSWKYVFYLGKIIIFKVFAKSMLQVGAKLAVLDSQDPPQSHQNPVFWEHVPKMLPKRLQSGSKRGPKEGPGIDFRRISDRFGGLCSLFLAVKMHSLNQNSRYHMYLLSDAITWKVHTYRLQATCPRKAGGMCVAQGIFRSKKFGRKKI